MVDKMDWDALYGQLKGLASEVTKTWPLLSEEDVMETNGNAEALAAKIAARYKIPKADALEKLKAISSSKTASTPKNLGSTTSKKSKATLKSSTGMAASAPNKAGSGPMEKPAKATLKTSSGTPASMPSNLGRATGKTTKGAAPEVNDEVELMAAKLHAKFGISKEQARQQIEGLKAAKAAGALKSRATPPPADAGLGGLDLGSLAGGLGALFGMGGAEGGANAQQPAGGDPISSLLGMLGGTDSSSNGQQRGGSDPISSLLGMLGGQDQGTSGGNLEGIAGMLMDQFGIGPDDALEKVFDWVKKL